jgi:8-oxo-dGTP pyrophosphatase MutT (NUDIX family)
VSAEPVGSDPYLDDAMPLRPGDAAAAILVAPGPRYVLQLRDPKYGIFFPGKWGCFGGEVEKGDANAVEGLRRELREELNLDLPVDAVSYFTNYTFDMTFCGAGVLYRRYFEAKLDESQLARLRLSEGTAFHAFAPRAALALDNLVPYDAFALWMHANAHRLRSA